MSFKEFGKNYELQFSDFFRMSKEPIRQTYVPQYTGYNQPVMNSPTMQHYGGYPTAQYAPEVTMHPVQPVVVADGMVCLLFYNKLSLFVSELPEKDISNVFYFLIGFSIFGTRLSSWLRGSS